MIYLQYLWYVIRHKWFVFIECCKLGIPLAGITHDLSKLLPDEFIPYARYFYGPKVATNSKVFDYERNEFVTKMEPPAEVKEAFDKAWNHHQKRNPHHWQYWLLSPDNPRPNFGLCSHGEPQIYGHDVTHFATGIHVLYVPPQHVSAPGSREAIMERALIADFNNTPIPLDIPLRYRKEMVADWRGAGRALGKPDTKMWYLGNKDNQFLHPNVRSWVEEQLAASA